MGRSSTTEAVRTAKLIDGTGTYAEEDVRTARNAEALNGQGYQVLSNTK